jgi:hypothetical protein
LSRCSGCNVPLCPFKSHIVASPRAEAGHIPRSAIDQDSREFRFANRTSTDDDVKLRMLTFLVHKDAVAGLLAKFL